MSNEMQIQADCFSLTLTCLTTGSPNSETQKTAHIGGCSDENA